MNRNQYLEVLELQPGVSKKEIKSAYRRLAKKYHPDVSKNAHAKEKFIRINEAYKFLMDVGAHPRQQTASSTAYDYDPYEQAYQAWRQRAKTYAKKKAAEAEMERSLLIKEILIYFNYATMIIGLFNILLAVDYLLPAQTRPDEVQSIEKMFGPRARRYGQSDHSYGYTDIVLKTNTIRIEAVSSLSIKRFDPVQITSSRIFNEPISMIQSDGYASVIYEQAYGIYRGFGFLIPIVLACLIFYHFIVKSQENRFSLAIVLLILMVIQLYIFISV
ncbi:DnaJ domain-containing protein [Fulvivirgaceae bacterium BMA12]|uniref:DnaJ domain-containing protein n=1 Tax=Agaribacillus aureus TaxID=3051825 RepID=A0ABT8L198_9BACT|nr:DnaJ domain-containing protein [Fulvivirgaceae bacterium BMA12]